MQIKLSTSSWHLLVAVLVVVIATSTGCFVRNCPPGGKRSLDTLPQERSLPRQCMSCGPDGLGQCLGPNICCGVSIGCFINSAEAEVCRHENDIRVPCEVEGAICGTTGEGQCVADGVCCNDEKCTLDQSCEDNSKLPLENDNKRSSAYNPDLVRMLRRILDRRSYPGRK